MPDKICPRCGGGMGCYSTSWFEDVEVCIDCRDEEKHAPNYTKARAEELASVRRGERNFAGIGLAPEDVAALAVAREKRAAGRFQ